MGADSQTLDGIYKDWFRDEVSSQVNNRDPLKDLFKFTSEEAGGREVTYPTQVSRNISPMFARIWAATASRRTAGSTAPLSASTRSRST